MNSYKYFITHWQSSYISIEEKLVNGAKFSALAIIFHLAKLRQMEKSCQNQKICRLLQITL
jgi:hypothetical protein